MFKSLLTAFLGRQSPLLIDVGKWNASIKSREKEKLTSSFNHFVNNQKIKTSWDRLLFINFLPRTHQSIYMIMFRNTPPLHPPSICDISHIYGRYVEIEKKAPVWTNLETNTWRLVSVLHWGVIFQIHHMIEKINGA